MKRARELEAEAFRIETAMKRLGVDAPEEWLAMAKDARRRRVPEPEPAALAHRAFRAQLAATPDRRSVADDYPGNRGVLPQGLERSRRGAHEPVAVGSALRDRPGDGLSRRSRRAAQGVRPPALGRCQRSV